MASEFICVNLFWKHLSHIYSTNNAVPSHCTTPKSLLKDDSWMNCAVVAASIHVFILGSTVFERVVIGCQQQELALVTSLGV